MQSKIQKHHVMFTRRIFECRGFYEKLLNCRIKVLEWCSLHSSKEWSTISVADKGNLEKQTVEGSEFW